MTTTIRPLGPYDLREAAARLYGLAALPTPAEFAALAEAWRPFRTWTAVLLRAAAPRLGP